MAAATRTARCDVCRLTLTIRGTAYAVRPIRVAPGFGATRAVRLRRPATGEVYDVASTLAGATCDCPDFVFRRDGIDPAGCKHVRACRAAGLID